MLLKTYFSVVHETYRQSNKLIESIEETRILKATNQIHK